MTPALAQTLAGLAPALAGAQDDWWIIGSAAVSLLGADPGPIADVDLLVSPRDARRLAAFWNVTPSPPRPDPQFRSEVYFQWSGLPLPVDVMAGFEVMGPAGWAPVRPGSRQAIDLGATVLYTPDKAELLSILGRFGRPKDLARAARLAGA